MTMRYQHLSPGHLRDAIRALEPHPVEAATPEPERRDRVTWAQVALFRHRRKTKARGVRNPAPRMVDDTGLEPVTPGM